MKDGKGGGNIVGQVRRPAYSRGKTTPTGVSGYLDLPETLSLIPAYGGC